MLGIGLVLGLVMAFTSRGKRTRDHAAEAWAKKDLAMDQLRALRADRPKLDPAVYAQRWDTLLGQAAQALKQAESVAANPPPEEPVVVTEVNWKVRAAWGFGSVLFFVGLGFLLQTSSALRTQGGTMTGNAQGEAKAELDAARATLETDPDNMDALDTLAHDALRQGDFASAMQWIDKGRAIDSEDAGVLTHLAIMQVAVGMLDRANAGLEQATTQDPEFSEAWLWRGMITLRTGEREDAIPLLEQALASAKNREERQGASTALAEARRPPATVQLRGTIRTADGVAPPSGGVLFIMVRRSEDGAGPPVAARRLDPRSMPGQFTITDRDMMMGGAWPEQVWVDARIDGDGNPTTRSEDDWTSARLGPFAAGAKGLELVLGSGLVNSDAAKTEPAQSGPAKVAGELALAEGSTAPPGSTLFVIARRTATPQGPPVAALRLPPSAVPGAFSMDESNIMMGGPWPDQVWLQARLDADGNAMTRSDEDVSSPVIGPVLTGTTDVVLTLGG
jgi:hypothetical protein